MNTANNEQHNHSIPDRDQVLSLKNIFKANSLSHASHIYLVNSNQANLFQLLHYNKPRNPKQEKPSDVTTVVNSLDQAYKFDNNHVTTYSLCLVVIEDHPQ